MIGIALSWGAWIVGKLGFGWALSLFGGGFMSVIGKAFGGLLDLAMIVGTWVLKIMLKGLSHILKSTPAVMAVLAMSWGSYEYGKYTSPVKTVVHSASKNGKVNIPSRKPEAAWIDKVWGN